MIEACWRHADTMGRYQPVIISNLILVALVKMVGSMAIKERREKDRKEKKRKEKLCLNQRNDYDDEKT